MYAIKEDWLTFMLHEMRKLKKEANVACSQIDFLFIRGTFFPIFLYSHYFDDRNLFLLILERLFSLLLQQSILLDYPPVLVILCDRHIQTRGTIFFAFETLRLSWSNSHVSISVTKKKKNNLTKILVQSSFVL